MNLDLFWQKVDRSEDCWNWRATLNKWGYGTYRANRKTWKAHRLAYTLLVGPIPVGLMACHKCDNRRCVNPAHIFLGTAKDNFRDAMSKKRIPRMNATHCIHGHEFSKENTFLQRGTQWRRCRKCYGLAHKKWRKAKILKAAPNSEAELAGAPSGAKPLPHIGD